MVTIGAPAKGQRRRDDNKNKICAFEGGGAHWGQRGKSSKNAVFFLWGTPRQYNLESANFIVETFCCHYARAKKARKHKEIPRKSPS